MITPSDVNLILSPRDNPEWKRAVSYAIMGLFLRQTDTERKYGFTHDRNNKGFNANDARKGTKWGNIVDRDGIIPDTDIYDALEMTIKYRRQIFEMMRQGEIIREAERMR